MATPADSLIHPSRIPNRWIQLIAGIVAMMAIANLQYAWTLFTKPIQAHLHVSLVAVQWTFTLFVFLETWLVPFEGYLVDRIGPRFMLGLGSIFVATGMGRIRLCGNHRPSLFLVLRWAASAPGSFTEARLEMR